jgi:hypothetical protein
MFDDTREEMHVRGWRPWASVMAGLLAAGGCGAPARQSAWVAQDVTVDAELGEWHGHLDVFEDAGGDLGVLNDDRNLYVSGRSSANTVVRAEAVREVDAPPGAAADGKVDRACRAAGPGHRGPSKPGPPFDLQISARSRERDLSIRVRNRRLM